MTAATEMWANKCAEQTVTIARLREALKKIVAIKDDLYGSDWQEIEEARSIAADALSR
jgi:hypothetical protein